MGKKISTVEAKHRLFVEEYYKNNCNATKAYMQVYGQKDEKSASASAAKLLRKDSVQAIIAEIESQMLNKTIVTKEEIIQSNIAIRDEAKAQRRYSDAIRANEQIAKLCGYYTADKVEMSGVIKFEFENLTENDIVEDNSEEND